MNASIQDVAKAAHVSISTVSRSFTRPELVSAATREKVLRIAEELNFSTSRSAAALKTGRAMRVALLMSDHIRLWFSASVIEGLNSVMPRELGFTAAVNIDDTQGSILAARHLINLGHRDIAYVRTNRDVSLHFSVQQRFDSFMECCAGSGISPTVIVAQEGPDRIRRVLTDLMSLERMPTAIACQEDGIAVPLIFQLERSGYEVPNDISVIGYDNSFYANDIGLTTIAQDPIEMAKMAAEMTVKLIEGEKPEHLFRTIPAELVVRSSTAKHVA